MITRIKFLSIPVHDQVRAAAWYVAKLGCTVTAKRPMGDQHWVELALPGAETRLVLFIPNGMEDKVGTFVNMAYESADVRRTYDELTARGVEFTQPPTAEPWGCYALFKDSEGNVFCIASEDLSSPVGE